MTPNLVSEVKHLGYEAGDFNFFDAKKMRSEWRSSLWTGEDVFSSQGLGKTIFTKASEVPGLYEGTGSTGNVFLLFANKNCHTSSDRWLLAHNEDDIR